MLMNSIILKVYADDNNDNQYEEFGETLGEIGLYGTVQLIGAGH